MSTLTHPLNMKIVALEEHFVIPELVGYGASTAATQTPAAWQKMVGLLSDFLEKRIPEMDKGGLDMQVLSLNSPGIQAESDRQVAISNSMLVNDFLMSLIAQHPGRFAGWAALPLQDPKAAADELERTVTQFGFCGALINGHCQGKYLDHPDFDVVWERAAALDVPIYLHPAPAVDVAHVYQGHEELVGPIWSWGVDTGTQAMRIILGKVFDRHPTAKLILGHMGELLPYSLWRMDSRWERDNRHGIELGLGRPSDYVRRNIYITTSGVASAQPLLCALLAMGADHILIGTDYPFEGISVATEFLRGAPISEIDKAKIAHQNAERILHLKC
ncbi:MAG: amidohydrolase family protein [Cyanobacteria bacterium]|nr:amidohydrolase family protein [Cyanobacteriota bacterium]